MNIVKKDKIDIDEIVNRPHGSEWTMEEMRQTVEHYYKEVDGKDMNIDTFAGMKEHALLDISLYRHQITIITSWFNVAQKHFINQKQKRNEKQN